MPTKPASLLLIPCACCLFAGCEPYRIEYHKRPAFYDRLVESPLDDRVVLDDGTVLIYQTRGQEDQATSDGGEKKVFQIREELDDGSIVLRALMPEHVMANTLECLRTGEYELLWDQLLSERTKLAYAEQGQGCDEFAAFFQTHRRELAKTLNRMLLGIASHEVVIEDVAPGVTECRFWPQIARDLKFKKVTVVREDLGMKLLMIS